jgi:hypothetical protein
MYSSGLAWLRSHWTLAEAGFMTQKGNFNHLRLQQPAPMMANNGKAPAKAGARH